MVVYLDVLFFTNVLMDWITLLAAARLGGAKVRQGRLALASLLGGVYAAGAALLPLLAALPALGAVSERRLLFGAGYYFAVPLRLLLLAAALGYTLSGILLRGDAKHGSIRRDIRPLTICFSGRERRVRVLEDTGHSLTEPVSGKPVLILCRGEAALLLNDPLDGDAAHQLTALPAETAAHCGLVPYRAVGTESGLLLYFRPDRVLEADGKTLDCVCAAGPPGFESGQYEGLICV